MTTARIAELEAQVNHQRVWLEAAAVRTAVLAKRLMILNDHEPNDVLPEAAARVAELEAALAEANERSQHQRVWLEEAARKHDLAEAAARIAKLEAEVARLTAELAAARMEEREYLARSDA